MHFVCALRRALSIVAVSFIGLTAGALGAEEIAVINSASYYPEGPLWDNGKLYYAEMDRDRIMVWNGSENAVFWHGAGCGPTTISRSPVGFYVFCHSSNRIHEVSAMGRPVRTILADDSGEPVGNPNESIRDSVGGVYFTSSGVFASSAPATGRVFYISPAGAVRKVAESIRYANGLVLTPRQDKLIVGAHLERRLIAYPVTSVGHLGPGEPFLDLNQAMDHNGAAPWYLGPDGLLFDREGNLYVCEYGGGRILIFDRALKVRKEIRLASPFVNAGAFGVSEQILYVGAADTITGVGRGGKVYEIRQPLD